MSTCHRSCGDSEETKDHYESAAPVEAVCYGTRDRSSEEHRSEKRTAHELNLKR